MTSALKHKKTSFTLPMILVYITFSMFLELLPQNEGFFETAFCHILVFYWLAKIALLFMIFKQLKLQIHSLYQGNSRTFVVMVLKLFKR